MWGQKFRGRNSDFGLGEGQAHLKAMFKMCRVHENVQLDLIINCLEGEAKRQILILDDRERNSPDQIFVVLKELYGDQMSASVLRPLCFDCKQEPNETVSEFTLRLQELFQKLKNSDRDDHGNINQLMRDQFLEGLRDRMLRRELRTIVLVDPELSFARVKTEAMLRIIADQGGVSSSCFGTSQVPTPVPLDLKQLRQELKAEMVEELKSQMAALAKDVVGELRATLNNLASQPPRPQAPRDSQNTWQRQPLAPYPPLTCQSAPPVVGQSQYNHRSPSSHHRGPNQGIINSFPPSGNMFQYDEQGRPFCMRQTPGHIQRFCPRQRNQSHTQPPLNC